MLAVDTPVELPPRLSFWEQNVTLRTGLSIGVFAISRLKSLLELLLGCANYDLWPKLVLFKAIYNPAVSESSLPKSAYILSVFYLEFDSLDNGII